MNVEVTPRVTYEGEIILELVVENSTVSGSIDVGGQSAPTFGTRKVTTKLRMREGESNLLAGLLREEDRRTSAASRVCCGCPCSSSSCRTTTSRLRRPTS